MTKTTKNITINEKNTGFEVRNNYKTVATTNNIHEAEKIAYEIAKAENKKVIENTEFYKMTFTIEEMERMVG